MSGLLAAVNWAALDFDVNIRGILVVLTGVVVLMGSVWLMLGTNTGNRLSTLITISALFGWMTIMGLIWWIYGIGWVGASPTWRLLDTNRADLTQSSVQLATRLPNEVVTSGKSPYQLLVEEDSPLAAVAKKEYTSDLDPALINGLEPAEQAKRRADWKLRNELVTLSEIKAIAPNLIKEWQADGTINLGGWRLMTPAQGGEAIATASNDLVLEGLFTTVGEFKVLDAYDKGGKPRRPDNPNRWDRISTWVGNSVRIKHPPRYAIVQVQQVVKQEPEPGEAPPRPQPDDETPIISVIMERNLGNRRFKPAMVTFASAILFGVSAYMLHERDKRSMLARAATK
jgi:hypothetical protein